MCELCRVLLCKFIVMMKTAVIMTLIMTVSHEHFCETVVH